MTLAYITLIGLFTLVCGPRSLFNFDCLWISNASYCWILSFSQRLTSFLFLNINSTWPFLKKSSHKIQLHLSKSPLVILTVIAVSMASLNLLSLCFQFPHILQNEYCLRIQYILLSVRLSQLIRSNFLLELVFAYLDLLFLTLIRLVCFVRINHWHLCFLGLSLRRLQRCLDIWGFSWLMLDCTVCWILDFVFLFWIILACLVRHEIIQTDPIRLLVISSELGFS